MVSLVRLFQGIHPYCVSHFTLLNNLYRKRASILFSLFSMRNIPLRASRSNMCLSVVMLKNPRHRLKVNIVFTLVIRVSLLGRHARRVPEHSRLICDSSSRGLAEPCRNHSFAGFNAKPFSGFVSIIRQLKHCQANLDLKQVCNRVIFFTNSRTEQAYHVFIKF